MVERLRPSDAENRELVAALTDLVNVVYLDAERGLWNEGAVRTDADEMAGLIRAGEIFVVKDDERIIGSVRFRTLNEDACEFGILVAAPDRRGEGIGRELVDFAAEETARRGKHALRLELLVPRNGSHPEKEFLKGWYGRLGFRMIGTRDMSDAYPHVRSLLATPCDLRLYERPVRQS